MTFFNDRRHASRRTPSRCPAGLCLALAAACAASAHAADDLTALSLEDLLEVRIVGASKYEQKQGEVAAAVSVITRQEIKTFGWRTLAEAVASLPGVYSTYNRQTTYFGARGFGLPGDFNTRVLVMVDGNRVNDPTYDWGLIGWDFPLDLDLVDRIEFIPGPGGAVYGQNAMFGVINVITRRGADVGGVELAAAYQQPQKLRAGRASWGKLLDNGVDLTASVSGLRSRGEDGTFDFGPLPVSGVAVGMDGLLDRQFFGRIARGPWSLEQVYGWGRKDDPTAAFFSTPLVPGQSKRVSSSLTQLQYEDSMADGSLQFRARLFNGTGVALETLSFSGFFYETTGRSEWRGAELRLVSAVRASHKLMLGFEGQDDVVSDQSVHGRGFVDPSHDFVIHSPGFRVGLYAQDEWRISDSLSTTLGLRVDRNNLAGTKASPRAALIWQAATATTLKLLYGRAHRAPNAYERDYDDGHSQIANPALRGESIDTLEFVADQRVGNDLALRASVYQWTMRDLITQHFDPTSGLPPQYQSGETVKAHGLELSADKTWSGGARLRANVGVQDATYAGGGALLNSPKLLGKINLSGPLPWGRLRAGYEMRYDGSRQSRDGMALGGYAVSNLTLSADALAEGLDLSVGIFNLLDKRYEQSAAENNWQNAFEQDGRSVRLKLGLRF